MAVLDGLGQPNKTRSLQVRQLFIPIFCALIMGLAGVSLAHEKNCQDVCVEWETVTVKTADGGTKEIQVCAKTERKCEEHTHGSEMK